MINRVLLIGALLFVVVSLFCQTALLAQEIGEVHLSPSAQVDWCGDTDTLWLELNQNFTGLKMVSFIVSYDRDYVTPTKVIAGPDLPDGSFFDCRVRPDDSILIDIGFLASSFDGPGVLAGIVLTAHAAVVETHLDFSRSVVRNALNADVAHTTQGAKITIRQPGMVYCVPDRATISALDTVSVALRVDQNIAGIHCFMASVAFDTTLLKIVSVTEGPLLKAGGPTFFFSDTLKHPTDIGSCLLGYGLQVDGPGVLATVTFRARQNGGTSPLTFSYICLSDVDLDSMAVAHADSNIVVRANIAPTITTTPPSYGHVHELYVYDVDANGYPPPTYALQSKLSPPSPPVGMTIDAATGLIEWTPSTAGQYEVTVCVRNVAALSFQVFTIYVACCSGRVGNVNGSADEEPTIGDVSVLIDALFISGDPSVIACMAEADINQSGGQDPRPNDITIGDISTLIDYLFITGQSLGLPPCL